MRHSFAAAALTLCAACQTCPSVPAATPAGAAPCPAMADSQEDATSPAILELAEAVLQQCELSGGTFAWDCPAFSEWRQENGDLFEGPGGNATVLALLESDDARKRTLATERGFVVPRVFFADAKRAERLLKVVDKERDGRLLSYYGKFIAHIDGERMLAKEIEALAKHPTADFRRSLAEHALPQHQTPFALQLTKKLIDDPDTSVRRAAVRALSSGGRIRPSEPVCALLRSQLGRADKAAEDAIDAASSSKCSGMTELVVTELEKRATADVAAFGSDDAPNYSWALSSICNRDKTPAAVKTRIFDLAAKVSPTAHPWRKRSWIGLFRTCDPTRAKDALAPYLEDPDGDVAQEAKSETERLDESNK